MKRTPKNNLYIGVMSGTSLDGIDIALCEIEESSCRLIHSLEYPFSRELKEDVLALIQNPTSLQAVGLLDYKLGVMYAQSLTAFLQEFQLDINNVEAIGLHGQTLWHEPDGEFPFSMQLGDANIVAAQTGIKTVGDFRRMDMANGGQGAPFAPAFHQFVFGSLSEHIAVVNIGGMANITLLEKSLRGWDSGCGNVLLDSWIHQTQNRPYDKDGAFARSGEINQSLLDALLADKYFTKSPPKSTGREYFNDTWLANHLPLFETISEADIQRTLLELTARSIANDLNATTTQKTIVCGGGSKNDFLLQRLSELLESEVVVSDTLGVSSDYLEAMAFAWFAYKRIKGEKVDLCSVTGASKASLLGGIYE